MPVVKLWLSDELTLVGTIITVFLNDLLMNCPFA